MPYLQLITAPHACRFVAYWLRHYPQRVTPCPRLHLLHYPTTSAALTPGRLHRIVWRMTLPHTATRQTRLRLAYTVWLTLPSAFTRVNAPPHPPLPPHPHPPPPLCPPPRAVPALYACCYPHVTRFYLARLLRRWLPLTAVGVTRDVLAVQNAAFFFFFSCCRWLYNYQFARCVWRVCRYPYAPRTWPHYTICYPLCPFAYLLTLPRCSPLATPAHTTPPRPTLPYATLHAAHTRTPHTLHTRAPPAVWTRGTLPLLPHEHTEGRWAEKKKKKKNTYTRARMPIRACPNTAAVYTTFCSILLTYADLHLFLPYPFTGCTNHLHAFPPRYYRNLPATVPAFFFCRCSLTCARAHAYHSAPLNGVYVRAAPTFLYADACTRTRTLDGALAMPRAQYSQFAPRRRAHTRHAAAPHALPVPRHLSTGRFGRWVFCHCRFTRCCSALFPHTRVLPADTLLLTFLAAFTCHLHRQVALHG